MPELELNLRYLHWADLFEPDGLKRSRKSIAYARETTLPAQNEEMDSPSTVALISVGGVTLPWLVGVFKQLVEADSSIELLTEPPTAARNTRDA